MGVARCRVGSCGRDGPGCGAPTGLTVGDGGMARPSLGVRPPLGRVPARAGRSRGAGADIMGTGLLVLAGGGGAGASSVGIEGFIIRGRWLACCCWERAVWLCSPQVTRAQALDDARQVGTKGRERRRKRAYKQMRKGRKYMLRPVARFLLFRHCGSTAASGRALQDEQGAIERSGALIDCTWAVRGVGRGKARGWVPVAAVLVRAAARRCVQRDGP